MSQIETSGGRVINSGQQDDDDVSSPGHSGTQVTSPRPALKQNSTGTSFFRQRTAEKKKVQYADGTALNMNQTQTSGFLKVSASKYYATSQPPAGHVRNNSQMTTLPTPGPTKQLLPKPSPGRLKNVAANVMRMNNAAKNFQQAGKTGAVDQTNTGVLDEFRKSQLRNQVIQHTDQSLPPLTNRAEEMIKSGRSTPLVVPVTNNNPTYLPRPAQPGPKSDNKFSDVLVQHPQKIAPLSQNLKNGIQDPNSQQTQPLPKHQLIPQFAQIVRNAMNYV